MVKTKIDLRVFELCTVYLIILDYIEKRRKEAILWIDFQRIIPKVIANKETEKKNKKRKERCPENTTDKNPIE